MGRACDLCYKVVVVVVGGRGGYEAWGRVSVSEGELGDVRPRACAQVAWALGSLGDLAVQPCFVSTLLCPHALATFAGGSLHPKS